MKTPIAMKGRHYLAFLLMSWMMLFTALPSTGQAQPPCPPGSTLAVSVDNINNNTCNVLNFPNFCFATRWVDYQQGMTNNVPPLPIAPIRSDPDKGLGLPQYDDTFNFFSLGFGGWIILEFDQPILNGAGFDFIAVETTFGNNNNCAIYNERARIFVSQDNVLWYEIMLPPNSCLDYEVDIDDAVDAFGNPISLADIKFVKIIDISNPRDFGPGADGWDLDGLQCLNGFANVVPGGDGTVNVSASGGLPPYVFTYQKLSGPGGSGVPNGSPASLINAGPGTYQVTVRDAAFCEVSTTFVISQPDPIVINGTIVNAGCLGANNGSIFTSVTGGTPPYSYTWSNSRFTPNNTNIGAGLYTLIVKDANNCEATRVFEIQQPTTAGPLLSASVTKESCRGSNDGGAVITLNPCFLAFYQAPYSFLWSNGQSGNVLSNVGEGEYEVMITDANGATEIFIVVIEADSRAQITINSVQDVSCHGLSDGSANISATGCAAPYSVKILDFATASTLFNINALPAGQYYAVATGTNGGTDTAFFEVEQPLLVEVGINFNTSTCLLTGTAINAALPLQSQTWVRSPGSNIVATNTSTLQVTTPGIYSYVITDANGCTKTSATRSINQAAIAACQPAPVCSIAVNPVVTNPICAGQNGSVNLNVTGANGSFTLSPSLNLGSLSAGSYSVTVTDAANCSTVANFTIVGVDPISINVSKTDADFGQANGTATANVSGGSAPYQLISWSNGQFGVSTSGLAAGPYSVTVIDRFQCTATANFIINELPVVCSLSVNPSTQDASCFGGLGAVNLNISGANGAVSYSPSSFNPSNSLPAGSYSITVTDAARCSAVATFTIGEPAQSTRTIQLTTCNPSEVGSINRPYTDANGCQGVETVVTVLDPGAVLSATIETRDVSCFGGNDGSVGVFGMGGSGDYSYNFGGLDPNALSKGTYNVTITDNQSNCASVVRSFSIGEPSAIQIGHSLMSAEQTVNGSTLISYNPGSASFTITGGKSPYQVVVSSASNPAQTFSPSNGFNYVLNHGDYKIVVTDNHQCIAEKLFTIGLNVVDIGTGSGCYASEALGYNPGFAGRPGPGARQVLPARRIADNATGAPNAQPAASINPLAPVQNFVSLGFGGSIVLKFSDKIAAGPGADLIVWETTALVNGNEPTCATYPERARVSVSQNGVDFVFIREICLTSEIDFSDAFDWIQYVLIEDVSNPLQFGNSPVSDGFDVDAVECLHGIFQPAAGCYAAAHKDYLPGFNLLGQAIVAPRNVADNALGAPQNDDTDNFVSLGFGGQITLIFDDYILNDGTSAPDIQIFETTFGSVRCTQYPEKAYVLASVDGVNFVYLGEICQDNDNLGRPLLLDLGPLPVAKYIKIIDNSNPADFAGIRDHVPDGFDVDAVSCLHGTTDDPGGFIPLTPCVATGHRDFFQGQTRNFGTVPNSGSNNRSDASKAYGMPQNDNTLNFVSLGFGGSIILTFDYAIQNMNGSAPDLRIVETTFGPVNRPCSSYPETVKVYASANGVDFVELGSHCLDFNNDYDISPLPFAVAIKLVDVSDRGLFRSATADGFDVDGVICLNQLVNQNQQRKGTSEANNLGLVEAMPNPFSNSINLHFKEWTGSEFAAIRIFNSLGQLVYENLEHEVTEGGTTEPIFIEGRSSGLYIITVEADGYRETIKMMKK